MRTFLIARLSISTDEKQIVPSQVAVSYWIPIPSPVRVSRFDPRLEFVPSG